jgi:ATP-binding cassette subfamily F protein uup
VVVSHDRYFLDRTAERLLVFQGDGVVFEIPGSYRYYAEQRLNVGRLNVERSNVEHSNVQPSNLPTNKPRKLTFKEQRELNELEGRIAALEAEQSGLSERVNQAGDDYQELLRLTAELERVGAELEAAVERWAELAEIAESA